MKTENTGNQLVPSCIDLGSNCLHGVFHGKAQGQIMEIIMKYCKHCNEWRNVPLTLLIDIEELQGQYLLLRKRNLEFVLLELKKQGYLDFDKKSAWLTESGTEYVRKHFCQKGNGKKRWKGKVRGRINRK